MLVVDNIEFEKHLHILVIRPALCILYISLGSLTVSSTLRIRQAASVMVGKVYERRRRVASG